MGRTDVAKILFKRATASAWTASNPVLDSGEPGYETDTGNLKIGDGVSAWNDLVYINSSITSSSTEPSDPQVGDIWVQI